MFLISYKNECFKCIALIQANLQRQYRLQNSKAHSEKRKTCKMCPPKNVAVTKENCIKIYQRLQTYKPQETFNK